MGGGGGVFPDLLIKKILGIWTRGIAAFKPLGSLGNINGDINENGIKAIGLDWQNNNFAHFFVNFFAITAWPRCENV